jgi:hypothetical protein
MALKPELSGEWRTMVREVLREAIAGRGAQGLSAVETIRIASDTDLQAFVQRLLDPAVQERLKSGKLRFSLAAASGPQPSNPIVHPPAGPSAGAPLNGVISEKTVDRHAGSQTLVIAVDAVVTPLARDRARQLRIKIERRR